MLRLLSFWVGKDEAPRVLVEYDVSASDFAGMPERVRYRDIQEWIADEYDGMKVSSLYIGQVKKKLGMKTQRDGNRTDRKYRQPQVTAEKEEAIVAAFKHFKML